MTFLNSKHTSTVKWPCMWVMQAAAVLLIVRLANLPDALQASNTHIQEEPPMMMHVPSSRVPHCCSTVQSAESASRGCIPEDQCARGAFWALQDCVF